MKGWVFKGERETSDPTHCDLKISLRFLDMLRINSAL